MQQSPVLPGPCDADPEGIYSDPQHAADTQGTESGEATPEPEVPGRISDAQSQHSTKELPS